ncbi:GNAT family N-acetyltransferase [Myxococcota bacterium]|nr:GNAT family N-acetyltransferase [Myxococcota bacterium]
MSLVVRPCSSVEELRDALVISHYFGGDNRLEDAQWVSTVLRPERMHAAHQDGQVVGGAGAYGVPIWLPGGRAVASTGVTVVGVLPTHRRQGVLTAMMRAQLDDARARGEAIAWLWASEATIYGRFGYGLASLSAEIDLPSERAALRDPAPGPERCRLVDHEQALATMPGLYDRVAARHAGMVGRDRAWWEIRRLSDHPFRRGDAGPLHRLLVHRDGVPVGFALYRVRRGLQHGITQSVVKVVEVMGVDPAAERAAWRHLLQLDWMARIQADCLPVDHPLLLWLAEPRYLGMRLADGVWLRLLDLPAAAAARGWGSDEALVIELSDPFCPWNQGRWRLEGGTVHGTDAAADLRMPMDALGSAWLGGFSWRRLVQAGRAHAASEEAVDRADRLFRTDRAPWCPEVF